MGLRYLTPLVAVAVLATLGDAAHAQVRGYERTEFPDFLARQRELHNRRVEMHAVFDSTVPAYPEPRYDAEYFKKSGFTPERHYLFSVTWRSQSRAWLYPVMDRKAANAATWGQLEPLKPGTKLTVYGRMKLLGDTGIYGGQADGPRRGGGGLAEVPSVLEVERVVLGWVKTVPEYVSDLDGDDTLVAETRTMLKREGVGVLAVLVAAVRDVSRSLRIRVHAAQLLGEYRNVTVLPKLAAIVREERAEVIRTAVLEAMLETRPADALAVLGELVQLTPPDAWAAAGAAALLASGRVALVDLQRAAGARWDRVAPAVGRELQARASQALERRDHARAVAVATMALGILPDAGPLYVVRGQARLAQTAEHPEFRAEATADLLRGLELGAGEVAVLAGLVGRYLAAGDLGAAEGLARRLGELRPDDPAGRRARIEVLLHRGAAALAAGDRPAAAACATDALGLDPKARDALVLKAKAEGKSLEMLEARLCTMNGMTVRLPAGWNDRPDFVQREGQVLGAQRVIVPGTPTSKPRLIELYVARESTPRQRPLPPPDVHLSRRFAINPQFVCLARGIHRTDTGHELAWGYFDAPQANLDLRRMWVIAIVDDAYLGAEFVADRPTFDESHPMLLEIAATLAWEKPAK